MLGTVDTWGELRDTAAELLPRILFNAKALTSPLVLTVTVAICLVLWWRRRPGVPFLAWLLPRRIYRAAGFRLDLAVFFLNLAALAFVTLNTAAFATAGASLLGAALDLAPPPPEARNPLLVALVVFLVADFCNYLFHRLHHEMGVLWPLHALHHSAEDLSILTAMRHHPVYTLANSAIASVLIGAAQALLLALVVGSLDVWTLLGTNAIYAAFNLAAANLRHSHIWLRWPVWLEHVLISPAMHQVHHSIDPRHRDRNYGEVLALWDWMFDTLYIPQAGETGVEVGLSDAEGRRLAQPHPTLLAALWVPLRDAWRGLRQRL